MITLYDFDLSGNCQKVRMLLSFLRLEYEKINLSLPDLEHKRPAFRELNPLQKVPVLIDDGLVIRDSSAILVYLAQHYGGADWHPESAADQAEIQQWLSFSVNEVFNGLAMLRAIVIFGRDFDLKTARAYGDVALDMLELRLTDHDWLALDRMTLADIACYPYAALVYQGNISLEPYPAVRRWFQRIESLPDYTTMPGLPYPHTN